MPGGGVSPQRSTDQSPKKAQECHFDRLRAGGAVCCIDYGGGPAGKCGSNNKGAYAMNQMLRSMCRADSFGVARLGEKEEVAALSNAETFRHYQKILRESPILITYVKKYIVCFSRTND